jgi:polyferredoxin
MKMRVYQTVWRIPEMWWFLGGNIAYYASGIALASGLRDNRAFCKYVCPIVAFLKIGAKVSLMKVGTEREKCTECGTCEEYCPMDIGIIDYIREGRRVTSTECVICQACTSVCPQEALQITLGFDLARDGHLRRMSN